MVGAALRREQGVVRQCTGRFLVSLAAAPGAIGAFLPYYYGPWAVPMSLYDVLRTLIEGSSWLALFDPSTLSIISIYLLLLAVMFLRCRASLARRTHGLGSEYTTMSLILLLIGVVLLLDGLLVLIILGGNPTIDKSVCLETSFRGAILLTGLGAMYWKESLRKWRTPPGVYLLAGSWSVLCVVANLARLLPAGELPRTGVGYWLLSTSPFLLFSAALAWLIREADPDESVCRYCGYCLFGSRSRICPECGTLNEPSTEPTQ
jgi:hypothetical protein